MNLKPIYDTGTITFIESPKNINLKKIDSSFVKDPKGIIPNGIYKVFRHEKHKHFFLLFLNFSIITSLSIILSLFLTVYKKEIHWFWFCPVLVGLVLSLVKFIYVALDAKHLSASIKMYRESLIAGSKLTPPFISNIYIKLFKKQIRQNWIVIAFIFYGTLITLLFWWLKDVDWWIFHFKNWIKTLTKNPETIGAIMVSILIFVLFLHIYFMIYRKKRIIDIQSFFGNEVISQVEIDAIVNQLNKTYKKMFFISVLVILIFPFMARIIYKKIKK